MYIVRLNNYMYMSVTYHAASEKQSFVITISFTNHPMNFLLPASTIIAWASSSRVRAKCVRIHFEQLL